MKRIYLYPQIETYISKNIETMDSSDYTKIVNKILLEYLNLDFSLEKSMGEVFDELLKNHEFKRKNKYQSNKDYDLAVVRYNSSDFKPLEYLIDFTNLTSCKEIIQFKGTSVSEKGKVFLSDLYHSLLDHDCEKFLFKNGSHNIRIERKIKLSSPIGLTGNEKKIIIENVKKVTSVLKALYEEWH